MGSRRKARETALQALYQVETTGENVDRAIADFAESFELSDQGAEFSWSLVRGVLERRAEIDEQIAAVTANWKVERLSRIDLCAIRVAVYEMLANPELPVEIIIDEAVEIARKFGTRESSKFVNGVLDPIAKRVRPTPEPGAEQPPNGG
jgi:N utilization substance protein B